MGVVIDPKPCAVLLVEDDPANTQLVLAILDIAGCAVTAVTSGADAIDALGEKRFSLVLMDVNMQGMDGMEATRVIRSRESVDAQSKALIVGLTGRAMPDEIQQCIDAGMDQVLVKPIDVANLLRLVTKACQSPPGAGLPPSDTRPRHVL